jgi:integration host factor subunit beta
LAIPEIIKNLKKQYPKVPVQTIINLLRETFDEISKELIQGKAIEIRKFGRWSVKKIKQKYNAINPRTGERIYIPEKKKISFKMAKELKDIINNSK